MNTKQEPHAGVSRRDTLMLISAGLVAGPVVAQQTTQLPSCVLTPEQTEGPFFVDERLQRADIRIDPADGSVKAGVPLALLLRIHNVGNASCTALPGAIVDIWHCDAQGVYSDVAGGGANTEGRKFLRGYQTSDANGEVRFTTIYPGWYPGRAVHIHFKVRTVMPSGKTHEMTSQLYFDEAISDRVLASPPYGNRRGRRVKNEDDGLFRHGGRQLMLVPVQGPQGYTASFNVGLRLA